MKIKILINMMFLIIYAQSAPFDFSTVFPGVDEEKLNKLMASFSEESMELPIERVAIEGKPDAIQMIGSNIHPRDFDKDIFSTLADKNILEVGPGLGHTTGLILLTNAAHLTIIEQSETAIAQLNENLRIYEEIAPQKEKFNSSSRFTQICGSILDPNILLEKEYDIVLITNVLHFMTPSQAMNTLHTVRTKMIENDESRLYLQMNATPEIKEVFNAYLEHRKSGKKYPGHIGCKTHNVQNGAIICCEHIDETDHSTEYPAPIFQTIGLHNFEEETPEYIRVVPTYVKVSSNFTADISTLTHMLDEADFEIIDISYPKRGEFKYVEPSDPTWENFRHELVVVQAKPRLNRKSSIDS